MGKLPRLIVAIVASVHLMNIAEGAPPDRDPKEAMVEHLAQVYKNSRR